MSEHNATDAVNQTVRQGYEAAREATDKGVDLAMNLSSNLRGFVRREPWIALLAAFAVGYTMAKMMRRVGA